MGGYMSELTPQDRTDVTSVPNGRTGTWNENSLNQAASGGQRKKMLKIFGHSLIYSNQGEIRELGNELVVFWIRNAQSNRLTKICSYEGCVQIDQSDLKS